VNCQDFRTTLDAYTADALNGPVRAAAEAHVAVCLACKADLVRTQALVQLLRSVQVPEPPAGLGARLARVAAQRTHQQRHRRVTWLAATATLVVGVAIGVVMRTGSQTGAEFGDEVTLTAGVVNTVALTVKAERPMEDVRFALAIPEGFELAGHEGKQQVAWSGELKPGVNRVKLRLRGREGSTGVLVATVKHEGQQKTFKVMLHAEARIPPGASGSGAGGAGADSRGTTASLDI
jgi:hypothetical protein